MILDKSKLTKNKLGTNYGYDVSNVEKDDEKYSMVWFRIDDKMYIVSRTQKIDGEYKHFDSKEFPLTADGFSKATDYFEELIAKQTKKEGENPDGSNNAPPIGFLEIMMQSIVSVEMQDGRKAKFTKNAYRIESNIFTILVDFEGFEKNERYYVDVIGSNPKIMGLYPVGDLESGDPSTSQKIDQEDIDDISDGKDPFDQKEDGKPSEPSPDGKPKDGKKGEPNPDGEPTDDDVDGEPTDEEDGEPKGGKPKGGKPSEPNPDTDNKDDTSKGGSGVENPTGDEEVEGAGTEKSIPTSQEILAKSYGVPDFDALVNLFGDNESLLENILSMDDMEKSGLMTKLATNYRDNSQFESLMRTIILNK